MRKEEEKSEGKFLWLDDTDERKYMTDRRNIRQIRKSRQLMLDQGRERTGKRFIVPV